MDNKPTLIQFPTKGEAAIGYLTVAAAGAPVPFEVRRVFWTYFTPHEVTRGRHAHYETEMVVIAVHGRIRMSAELLSGEKFEFVLEKPTQGLYLPRLCWHVMEYSHDAVQLALASTPYSADDYIRSYEAFRRLGNKI